MAKVLKDYFPIIRTREEILEEIEKNRDLQTVYRSWPVEGRESFLDFCTGVRGLEITYDGVSKTILDPELHPERLESLISALLGHKVKIRQILPNDSGRTAGKGFGVREKRKGTAGNAREAGGIKKRSK